MVKRRRTRKSTKPKHKRVLEGMFSNIEDAAEKAGVSLAGSHSICVKDSNGKKHCATRQYKSLKHKGKKIIREGKRGTTEYYEPPKRHPKFKASTSAKAVKRVMDIKKIFSKTVKSCKDGGSNRGDNETYLNCMKRELKKAHGK
ncbi:MAG: hypothetical protein M0P71_07270 [Melioribacteraceae bacterium]|jgi:hypothetical protein|nr:hypothetical protein [Melioribacteraceae bacterium]